MKITKAVIPAAGLGTRVLPISKSIPKEMLPIVDKPAMQYIVEEAVAAGITDILIITNRGKGAIEDHFDYSVELEQNLKQKNKTDILQTVVAPANLANIYFLRQKETRGLGHAVLAARSFIGDEPFAVLYGDDVCLGGRPAALELCEAYEKYKKGIVGIKECTDEEIAKYCTLKVDKLDDKTFAVSDMIEKPQKKEDFFSNYAVVGRCILPPSIFDILENTPNGAGGELQLTDAMKVLSIRDGMIGVEYESIRYDMGNKLGIQIANIEAGINHPEIGEDLKEYIKDMAKKI